MRKLSLIASGMLLAMAGSAQASLPVDVDVFMSGATAPSNMLREHIVENVCNQALPINVYVDVIGQNPGNGNAADPLPILEHTNHFVVQCTVGAGYGTTLSGKTLAFYKYEGGSSTGTTPVTASTALTFMDANATNCNLVRAGQAHPGGGTYNLYECGTNDIVNQVPDGGLSDIEPTKFRGTLAGSAAFPEGVTNLDIRPGPGLVFGVVVTTNFRNELQLDQGLSVGAEDEDNMPSLPSAYIRSVFDGKVGRWSSQTVLGNPVNAPVDQVNVCRRTQGSGTHAQWMIEFNRTNCTSGTPAMLSAGLGNPLLGTPNTFENSSSGNLGNCLNAINDGTAFASSNPAVPAGAARYAIGYQSTEKNAGLTDDYRFVKIDGVAPTLENAFNGAYSDVYYLSFQNRNNGSYVNGGADIRATMNATKVAAINDFFANALNISGPVAALINRGLIVDLNVNNVADPGEIQGGFLVPSSTAPTAFNAADPRTPWFRVTGGGAPESCLQLNK